MSHDINLAPHVAVSLTLVVQVRADSSTKESDVQTIYDNIPAENKGYSGSRARLSVSAVRLFWRKAELGGCGICSLRSVALIES